jgi:hypothetical protein
MEAGLFGEHLNKIFFSKKPSLIHASCILVFCSKKSQSSAEQTSCLQVVLQSSNDHDHVDGSDERPRRPSVVMAMTQFKGARASHGVAQVAIRSHVASQGTGVVNVHDVDVAIYCLSTCA